VKEAARRDAIKKFLHARRAAISPEECGLVRGKRRLTPGLRREEVALLAGVGVTWSRVNLEIPAALQLALDGFTSGPALVFSPAFDVLAHNAMARRIYALDTDLGP
jgi:hypothetical protein